ncbi:hypothetical protein FRC10_004084 [Ceratobasidium sp. 414]|nr:hypothetical protein FRC10_004084 [Ceratobasidium sp. 414]
MNSPAVIVSQYRPRDHQLFVPTTQGTSRRSESPAWQPVFTCPQRHTPVAASLANINETMDRYWTLVFEFTYPATVDFRDLQAGELASTRDSLMVFEYGQGLWNLLDSLRNMHVAHNEAETLERTWGFGLTTNKGNSYGMRNQQAETGRIRNTVRNSPVGFEPLRWCTDKKHVPQTVTKSEAPNISTLIFPTQ